MKVAGLTAVQTYVEWSSHQPEPGVLDFSGNLDLLLFLDTAAQLGLGQLLYNNALSCFTSSGFLDAGLTCQRSQSGFASSDDPYLTFSNF